MLESYFVSIHDHFNHEPFELLLFPFQSKEKSHDQMGRSEWTRGLLVASFLPVFPFSSFFFGGGGVGG